MSGQRPLTGGKPRMLGHGGAEGAEYRRAWSALVAEYVQPARGPPVLEMGRVAVAYCNLPPSQ